MSKTEIILSSGSIPWLGVRQALNYSRAAGYDGLEILPTRIIVKEIEDAINLYGKDRWSKYFSNLRLIKSIHQSWRLDIGLDREYKINFIWSLFFNVLRIIFFPDPNKSKEIIGIVLKKLNVPVVVHDISKKWTHDDTEFSGGIFYEIIGTKTRNPKEVKEWLTKKQHKIVVDTRDDQSLLWAKKNKFNDWRSFWKEMGVQNIGEVQVTLIGTTGLKKILIGEQSTIREQLLWLRTQKWKGVITVEVNPLTLFIVNKGKLKKGLQKIAAFVRQYVEF